MSPKDFILQTAVSPSDIEWTYRDTPKYSHPKKTAKNSESRSKAASGSVNDTAPHDPLNDKEFYLRHITFTEKLEIRLSFQVQKTNRILSSEESPFDNILVASFEKLRFPEGPKAAGEYIKRFLKTGIVLNGKTFKFYGHSNSQLKSRTCYMYAESNVQRLWDKINGFGDFSGINSVAKRAKRIGLLFSAAEMGIKLDPKNTQDIPDIEKNGQVYTDGCGFVSQRYAQELAKRSKIIFRDERYTPSVFQIRYKGYKGTVYVNPLLDKEFKGIKMQFRDSMRKFKNCPDDTFSILEYSKPYEFGKLNGELVSLLSSLGIPDEIFLRKLTFHLQFIQDAVADDRSAFQYLSYHNQNKLAEKIVLDGLTRDIRIKIRSLQKEDYNRFYKKNEAKVHIMIPESRLLFGICDSTGKLKENEIFLRITKEGFGRITLEGAEVVVSRNPCLHPGDIQKFKCVRIEELEHLVDCIVFSTEGDRPAPSLMSGGDLDGDKFFVSWDKELIPSCLSEPYGYPPAKESIRREIKYDDMITYFAQYNNASLGKCKNLYLKWMKSKAEGARSKECQELNALFSNCVDGQPIKIPDHLQNPPENPPKRFILDLLCDRVKAEVNVKIQTEPSLELLNTFPMTIIDAIASSDDVCLSEFELLQMVYRWTKSKKESLMNYLPYFDFSTLTSLQKYWIENQIPVDERRKWHGIIFNGLFTSEIVSPYDRESHHLNNEYVHWQQLYSSSFALSNNNNNEEIDITYSIAKEMLQKSLQLFKKKLIIVQVNSRFAYGIYINKLMETEAINLFQCCKLFAFTRTSDRNTSSRFITERDYTLNFDGEVFQLYQARRPNTFVYLRFGESVDDKKKKQNQNRIANLHQNQTHNQSGYKVTNNVYIQPRPSQESPIQNQQKNEASASGLKLFTSVALNKFSQGVKDYVGRVFREESAAMEIYVISNRDRIGSEILDISINQVDTKEVFQIIQNIPNEYTIPSVETIQLDLELSPPLPQLLKDIRRDFVPPSILALQPAQIFELCRFCAKYDLKSHLKEIVEYTLSHSEQFNESYPQVLDVLVNLLTQAPYLSILLTDCGLNSPSFRLALCCASIKCANEYQKMALELFTKTLESLILSRQSFDAGTTVELIKLIIFTVRDSALAQEFLLELFGQGAMSAIAVGGSETHGLTANEYFKRNMLPIAMNYVSEIQEKSPCDWLGRFITEKCSNPVMKCLVVKESPPSKKKENDPERELLFETILRVDCFHSIRNGDHLRLRASSAPVNQPSRPLTIIDVIVDSISNGCLKFRIQQQQPVELLTASWDLYECGSTTTLITMMEAVETISVDKQYSAWSYKHIVDSRLTDASSSNYWPRVEDDRIKRFLQSSSSSMNASQESAVNCAINNVTTLIWGPPGTGKTTVVVQIILAHLKFFPSKKILVTASTHNATDNILERVIAILEKQQEQRRNTSHSKFESAEMDILRVTSEVSKVNKKLQKWTLDAFVGANLHENHKKRKEAIQRLKNAKIIFSTCSGAGVGLLRNEELQFEVVIVDEASQLTEPNALVPIVKGSQRVVLVGDHVQLRPTVSELGKVYGGDTSLFERLYTQSACDPTEGHGISNKIGKAMLDVQYRMHPLLVQFPSNRFYDGRLKSGVSEAQRSLPPSDFPWSNMNSDQQFLHPVAFVQCDFPESRGTSKGNVGQAKLVREIIKRLRTGEASSTLKITVVTPYTLQLKELNKALVEGHIRGVDVVTIDGFQGRESDFIIFSTVRCNKSGAVGFLEDYRRMNVALTRAKFGLIVVGDENTLNTNDMWNAWMKQCNKVTLE